MRPVCLIILCACTCLCNTIAAQKNPAPKKQEPPKKEDPYIVSYKQALLGRLYISRRYTSLGLQADATNELRYRPNTQIMTGVNVAYRGLSVSLGTGFAFLNPNKDARGRTRSFDFQTHLYSRHWVTDLYAQWYKGYYVNQSKFDNTNGAPYYVRPDIRVSLLGASVYRLLNGNRFSYQAGFSQNEWQKKSAGSLLIGAEIYYGVMKGDSALVPSFLSGYYPQQDVHRVRLLELGPGIGYAYTAVWQEHFFITGGLTVNIDLSLVKESKPGAAEERSSPSPNAQFRMVGGYTNESWAVTLGWIHNSTNARGASSDKHYRIKTGGFSFTIARRFTAGPKLKQKLDPVVEKLP